MNYSKTNKLYKGNIEFLYAKISANMIHFFGNSSLDEHRKVLYRYLSCKEASYNRFINSIKYLRSIIPDNSITEEIDKSHIIYSYCIGEYRMLPVLLNQLGYSITVLVEERIKSRQSDLFFALNKYLNGSKLSQQRLKFISSGEDNVIWKLKSDITNGNKVLIFVDGNSGIDKNPKNLVPSFFFSQTVFLHQGISYLSHFIKTIPLGITMFYNEGFTFNTFKHNDNTYSDRNSFVENLTIEIFSDLEELLKNIDISKWDTLESIYKWLDIKKLRLENYNNGERSFFNNTNSEFNAFRYSPFCLGEEYFVFDKKQYLTYKIQKKDYRRYVKYTEL